MVQSMIIHMLLQAVFLGLCVFCVGSEVTPSLEEQINLTRQLIELYSRKLALLTEMQQQSNLTRPLSTPKPTAFSGSLVHLKAWEERGWMVGGRWLAIGGKVVDMEEQTTIGEYMGEVLAVEESQLTTLIGGRVATLQISESGGGEEVMLGISAEQLPSIWHRNLNIVGQQDLLVQWKEQHLWLQGKETQKISFNPSEQIINVYSINQYKVLVVTSMGLSVLNTRSQQISESIPSLNITNKQESRIVGSGEFEGLVYLIMSTGQLVRYGNGRVISVQMLPNHKKISQSSRCGIHYLSPFVMISNSKESVLSVYIRRSGSLQYVSSISVALKVDDSEFWFYRTQQTVKMVVSSSHSTNIYQLLLPTVQQPTNGFGIVKAVGVAVVVVAIIFMRMRKQGPKQKEQNIRPGSVGVGSKTEASGKGKMTESEIDAFLKRNKSKRA